MNNTYRGHVFILRVQSKCGKKNIFHVNYTDMGLRLYIKQNPNSVRLKMFFYFIFKNLIN